MLQKYLANYKNQIDAKLLLDVFTNGFRLQYTGPRMAVDAKNLNSASIYKFETLSILQSEVQLGSVIGPFKEKPISTVRISPIGLVEKSDGCWHLINHLSFPEGGGVNDLIDEKLCQVKYASLDIVLGMISALGKGAELGKNLHSTGL